MADIDLKRNSGIPSLGTHLFKITETEEDTGSTGYEYWKLTLICQTPGDDEGKKATAFVSHSPKARFKMDELLDAIDAPRQGRFRREQLHGKILRGTVVHDEREGRVYANVDNFLPVKENESFLATLEEKDKGSLPDDVKGKDKKRPF
jgi:hypothetical protein